MRQTLMVSTAALTLMVLAGRSVSSGDVLPVPPAGPEAVAVLSAPLASVDLPVLVDAAVPVSNSGFVTVRAGDGGSFEIHSEIADDVQRLFDDAAADGVVLGGWGLRSHQRQHELRRENGCLDGWVHTEDENPDLWASASSCRVPTARPGFSNHESGKAIDFTYGGSVIGSRRSPAFVWLDANAGRYGLQNLPSEPWHWSINGK